jgi:lysophospholipase L1-like esterase
MKTILCYGDSLTWGYDAEVTGRHALQDRWPSALQAELGASVHVVADGLNGRTTAYDDYLAGEDRNGARTLPVSLGTHAPLDLVIIMLGTNDLKPVIHGSAIAAKAGMARLAQIVRSHPFQPEAPAPRLLIVSPPHIRATDNQVFAEFFAGGIEESRLLAGYYKALSEEIGCAFFDAATVAETTPVDGIHLDAANTRAIGIALAPVVRTLLSI